MAYESCTTKLAASIAMSCSKPIVGGYTGRAILLEIADAPTITPSESNGRILSAIVPATSAKVIMIDNVFADPFNGSTKTSNADSGRVKFTKTLSVQIPLRGADTAKDVIEPLLKSAEGFLLIVEKKDRRGIGTYEVFGYQDAVKADPASYSRDESANGGAATVTLTCTEDWEEVDWYDTSYAATKSAFDALVSLAQ